MRGQDLVIFVITIVIFIIATLVLVAGIAFFHTIQGAFSAP